MWVGVGGVRQRWGDSCWSMWKSVCVGGTLREVTGEMEGIHITEEAFLGLGNDAVSPGFRGSLLLASTYSPSSSFSFKQAASIAMNKNQRERMRPSFLQKGILRREMLACSLKK